MASNMLAVAPVLDTIIGKYLTGNSDYSKFLGKNGSALHEEIEGLDTPNYHFVELGCGMAKVSRYINTKYQWKDVVGVEGELVVLTFARLRNFISKKKIRLVRANLFKIAIPEKSVVYCYLTTPMMDKLYKDGRLFGKLVISLSFQITGIQPTEKLTIIGFQQRVLVYDLRKVQKL